MERKTVNFQRGFKRLTLVISLLLGIGLPVWVMIDAQPLSVGFWEFLFGCVLLFLMGFVPVWVIYFFVRYIVAGYIAKGFKSDE